MKVFNTYFLDPIKNHYIDFGGKATRTQFWLFVLFGILIFLVLNPIRLVETCADTQSFSTVRLNLVKPQLPPNLTKTCF